MKAFYTISRAVIVSGCVLVAFFSIACGSSGSAVEQDAGSEEVAVGYGTQDRASLTSAVSHIEADEELRSFARVEEMLERTPGVRLVRSGGGIRVLIRGASSVHGRTDPLYVVDGMTIEVDPGQGLYWLDPNEIETIDVLRDAGATAIYGSRGASGVVIIKTRRR